MSAKASLNLNSAKFNLIEIGRFFAATLVVLHHTGSIMSQPRFYGTEPFSEHLRNFNVGVDFFFVLSGFIITWIHRGDVGHRDRIANFLRKRFLRIFPPYWVILLPLIILYQVFPNAGVESQRDPLNAVLSIFLLPNPQHPVLGVAWTLTYEVFFYGLFAAIIVGGQRFMWLLPMWAIAIVIWNLGPAGIDPVGDYARAHFPLSFLLNAYNIEFLMGVAAAEILRTRQIRHSKVLLSLGILLFIGFMLFAVNIQTHALAGRLAFSIPAVMFVLGAVEIERTSSLHINRFLALMGAASYAVYLVHPVALSLFVQASSRLGGKEVNLETIALALALLSVTAGVLYHVTIERPAIKWFGKNIYPVKHVGRQTNSRWTQK